MNSNQTEYSFKRYTQTDERLKSQGRTDKEKIRSQIEKQMLQKARSEVNEIVNHELRTSGLGKHTTFVLDVLYSSKK